MPVYKDSRGGWRVVFRYTDFRVQQKQTQKRGFSTQREAKQWEYEQMLKTKSSLVALSGLTKQDCIPYRETDNGFEAQECYAEQIRAIEKQYAAPGCSAEASGDCRVSGAPARVRSI